MKNIDYNSLLMYVSLILAMAILISIVFGCTYKKRGYREYFADAKSASDESQQPSAPSTSSTPSTPSTSSTPSTPSTSSTPSTPLTSPSSVDASLNEKEKKLKQQIEGGAIDEKKLSEMVEKNEVTTQNLKNVINAFQMQLNLK